jgi:ribulose-phosphate 3-epimerase
LTLLKDKVEKQKCVDFFMPKKEVRIGVSILSADFGHLADEAKRIEDAGADSIHIDVMDGLFVPNLSLGPRAVEAIRRSCTLFLDVHLMIYNPFDYVEPFIASGADGITFHFEATENVEDTLGYIHKCGKKAGLAFNPETPCSMVEPFLTQCDLILFMSVSPGFGGQKFQEEVVEKIHCLQELCGRPVCREERKKKKMSPLDIQVDGGIDKKTGKECVSAGANWLISGHYLLCQPNLKVAIEELKKVCVL